VLDVWFETAVKSRLAGAAFLIRYVDDFVLVFQLESDARRVLEILPKRFGRYGLGLHPDKTRLVQFELSRSASEGRQEEGPRSFDLLGFTHYWERSRRGHWVVKRKTASSRFSRTLRRINLWCRGHRHAPLDWQHAQLQRKLRGHDEFYGITGNSKALSSLRHWVARIWRKWLSRRSRTSKIDWARFNLLLKRYPLPNAKICHQA
jgi:RNA-directed DNA polymerase